MSTYDPNDQETSGIELDDRTRAAFEEYLTVTPELGRARGADDLTLVTSQSGKEYLVDVRDGVCECKDYEYRADELGDAGCKHVRRARIAMGKATIDAATLGTVDVDPQLGEHASGPRVVTSDGGVIDAETGIVEATEDDGAEVLEGDDGRPDDCDCSPLFDDLPCWPCSRDGFEDPNPDAEVEEGDA